MARHRVYDTPYRRLYCYETTEGASTLLIAQVKGLKDTC